MIQVETGTMIVSGRSDWPITGEERRKIEKRMSICLTWFPINDFRLNQYIPESGWFHKNVGFYLGFLVGDLRLF